MISQNNARTGDLPEQGEVNLSIAAISEDSSLRPLGRSLAIINDQKNSTNYRKYI